MLALLTAVALVARTPTADAQAAIETSGPASCAAATSDPELRGVVTLLERLAATPPVWDGYAPAQEPVLLALDTARFAGAPLTPACVLVWHAQAPLRVVELSAHPGLSTSLYGFLNIEPDGPRAQAGAVATMVSSRRITSEDEARLRAAGATRAVVIPVPLDLGTLGSLGEALRRSGTDPALIQAEMVVHEGFHLHVQFPAWLDQARRVHAWPDWDLQPDRREMRERCYAGSPAIATAFDAELGALLAAFDALYGAEAARDAHAARAAAQRFIELRTSRYALLDTTTVRQGDRRIGCALAETHLELEEGTAQWVGHATLLHAGVRSMTTLRGSYGTAQPDAFYRTGPLQLWILDALLGRDAVHALTARLARAASPDTGLHHEFARLLR